MMQSLPNNWSDIQTDVVLDANNLVKQLLEKCLYTINGYWDEEDKYYESITLPSTTTAELIKSSVGFSNHQRFLKLEFSLWAYFSPIQEENQPLEKIGELVIIYNENMEFIDENWLLEIDSPLIEKR